MKIDKIVKKSTQQFQINNLKAKDLLPLYNRLKELGYNEENIYSRLGVKDREFVMSTYLPFYLRASLKKNTPLDKLIRLFTLARGIEAVEMEEIFEKTLLDFCEEVGLLSKLGSLYISEVDLFPCMGGIFATDHQFTGDYRPNHVYPLGHDSYMLARGIIPRLSRLTLDLCTGSGVQAILASCFSRNVIGVDMNRRALNFARFNALLNQVENVKFIRGDLYEPVMDRKFDLILANPPFVPAPEQKLDFRDGGETGEEILKKIVEGIPWFLNDGGYAQIVTVMVYMEGSRYPEKLHRWLGEDCFSLLTLASRYIDVKPYILGHISPDRKFREYCDIVDSWALNYEKNRIVKLVEGLINIKKTGDKGWMELHRDVHRTAKPYFGEVKNMLDIMENQKDKKFLGSMSKMKFRLNPGIDFFWKGKRPSGGERYGVLFKEDALLVEDTELNEIKYEILCLIDSGKNTLEMIAEGLKDKESLCEAVSKEEIEGNLAELMVRGVVEIQE